MRVFNYNFLKEKQWDKEILGYIGLIHEYKGKQQLSLQQKAFELDRLVELAKIQSIESSNAIEGIVTTNQRLKQLMNEKTTPRNRCEQEILGYRAVFEMVHESFEYMPITANVILHFIKNYIFCLPLLVVCLKPHLMKLMKLDRMELLRLSLNHLNHLKPLMQ